MISPECSSSGFLNIFNKHVAALPEAQTQTGGSGKAQRSFLLKPSEIFFMFVDYWRESFTFIMM